MTLSCPLSPLHATSDLARSAGMRRRQGEARRCRVVTSRMIMGGKREIDLPKCQRGSLSSQSLGRSPEKPPSPLNARRNQWNAHAEGGGGKPPKEINHKGRRRNAEEKGFLGGRLEEKIHMDRTEREEERGR